MSIATKLEQIAANVPLVYQAGVNAGASGTDAFEEGKKAQYDEFWDSYQDNGNRTDYQYSFSNARWNDVTFKPKYSMVLDQGYTGTNMFWNMRITNLEERLEEMGVILDTSNAGHLVSMFQNARTEVIPELNLTSTTNISYLFAGSTVKIIRKLIITENTPITSNMFNNCSNLEEIRFEGIIGKTGLNLQSSTKLSKDSITSIVNALSSTTTGLTVTLSQTAVNAAFTTSEWDTLRATKNNWTISLI